MRKWFWVVVYVPVFLVAVAAGPVWADPLEEVKQMMQEMKEEYEARIKELEAKVESLSAKQDSADAKIEEMGTKQEAQLAKVDEKLEEKLVNFDYVGRDQAPVGRGGLLVGSEDAVNVSLGGYFDMEYRDFQVLDSTFQQHRWVLNVGAQVGERLRFNSEYEIEYG